ncbi:trans-sulfuration enzyme family protein [Thiohalorhabdus methylotrophus]|uniref:PLP-dependent aspartate aminotransferase family protein n=1 Tax=Thiohalorhabdus methylotrophus TaxID=3242694 RepID=A0ABV4TWA3_9GAMM
MGKRQGLATRCVHAGDRSDAFGSPHTPVYNTTTFRYPSTDALLDVVEGRAEGALYTRFGANPSVRSLEAKLAALEDAEAALAFTAGMGAESSLFFAHGREGIVCIGDAYGGTLELLTDQLPRLGMDTHLLWETEPVALRAQLEERLAAGARLVFLETPTNPSLEVYDIAEISEVAHAYGALVAVDNTFATPVNQNPLGLGADLVMHSATKYLGGHSDLTAGAVMGPAALLEPVAAWRKSLGQVPAPETATLLSRSLATLPLRVERQNATAGVLARSLAEHPRVARALYPGLAQFPGHSLAARQMTGFGGMVTFEVADADAAAVVDRLRLFAIAPSLGGVESLATQPVTTTHHGLSGESQRRLGITPAMVRLSVGLEDPEDLLADLEQALE